MNRILSEDENQEKNPPADLLGTVAVAVLPLVLCLSNQGAWTSLQQTDCMELL
jgi:hypothetical protein